jgi:hypothetical protein
MNEAFATLLTGRFTELTKDLRFDYKPTGIKRAPQIIQTFLPPKGHDHEEGMEFPLVRWAVYRGSFSKFHPSTISIIVNAGIWTSGSIIDGDIDIQALVLALGRIVKNRSFPPYRLEEDTTFHIGSQESGSEGIQPHPYYWGTMKLQFTVPSGHGG